MRFSDLKTITNGKVIQMHRDKPILNLLTDSRKLLAGEDPLFFAYRGERHDSHDYVEQLYREGIRQFVVERPVPTGDMPSANIILVSHSLTALQAIAAKHRAQFEVPVVGITGSNGKTIVKEWLFQLLSGHYAIVKNPGSYNSQWGVPLAVWKMQAHHTLGIFEAGISLPGEMSRLQKIIQPTLGIFTNLGTAHDEGFPDRKTKAREKAFLFAQCSNVICCQQHPDVVEALHEQGIPTFQWGNEPGADVFIAKSGTQYTVTTKDGSFGFSLPFNDPASLENVFHCIAAMLLLKCAPAAISDGVRMLRSVPMRLEMKEGINNCLLVDDSYNNDLAGLRLSLDFLMHQQQRVSKSLILSDILESGLPSAQLAEQIAVLVNQAALHRFIGIGPALTEHQSLFRQPARFFPSTAAFLATQDTNEFRDEVVLIKGARAFAFEQVVRHFQKSLHGTVLEINLEALVHNLNFFRARLSPGTRIMAMVKAFAYGGGSIEIANVLQFHKVDYLGVAYADEGVDLRQNQIRLPIMVMNPTADGFEQMIRHDLEPEIYSVALLNTLIERLQGRPYRVHLKLETGMNRLGIRAQELPQVAAILRQHPHVQVASILSHLAGADDPAHDAYSREQGQRFMTMAAAITDTLSYRPLLHLLNSAGALRLAEFQLDMVRLGIGLYGIDPSHTVDDLRQAATLKTIISQIHTHHTGETIGYGRKGRIHGEQTVATIAIGYADGFSRAFGNGVGAVLVNGHKAPVIGQVCMDMTMVDITGIPAEVGDEVLIYGKELPIEEVATRIGTIPYEVLTQTSARVKRVFYASGI